MRKNILKPGMNPVAMWQEADPWGPYIINALKAEHLYHRNIDYIVTEETKEIKIINQNTGRVLARSRWQDNMHQVTKITNECCQKIRLLTIFAFLKSCCCYLGHC